jgi:hypothetical protein
VRFSRDDRIENNETIKRVLDEAIDRDRAIATPQSLQRATMCERAHRYYTFILAEIERLENQENDRAVNDN